MPPADPPSDRSPASGHPDEESLELYALGRLPEPEAAAIEEHLLACHPCQDAMKELDEYVAAMKGALAEREVGEVEQPKPGFLDTLRQSKAMPALAVGIAALGLALVVVNQSGKPAVPVELTLRSLRGGGTEMAEAPAGAPLRLHLQSEQRTLDSSYQVKIVDSAGGEVWSGVAPSDGGTLEVDKALSSGRYWVRVYDAGGAQVQEYGLQVK
jgi:hypothetical protein